MVYSPNTGKLFCFCCRLFAHDVTNTSSALMCGFDQCRKLSAKVVNHEKSVDHIDNVEKWKSLDHRSLKINSTIDAPAS